MGIDNLFKLLKEHCRDAITVRNMEYFRDKTIYIDANLYIYQWCSIGISHNIKNKKGKYINHIQGMFFRTAAMLLAGIEPVYVFDGAPPLLKENTIQARKKAKENNNNAPNIPPEVMSECKLLLGRMGVRYLQAIGEADPLCAQLGKYIGSEDSDILPFGAGREIFLIRSLNAKDVLETIDVDTAISLLDLDKESFIDLCILLGSDYNDKMPKYGYKRIYDLIHKYRSIENIVNAGIAVPIDYNAVRYEFNRPIQGFTEYKFLPVKDRELDLLNDYLASHGLELNRIDKTINRLRVLFT